MSYPDHTESSLKDSKDLSDEANDDEKFVDEAEGDNPGPPMSHNSIEINANVTADRDLLIAHTIDKREYKTEIHNHYHIPPRFAYDSPDGSTEERPEFPRPESGSKATKDIQLDQEQIDKQKKTVLKMIDQGGKAQEFEELLESYLQNSTVDVNTIWEEGKNICSLLLYAVERKNENAIDILVKHGADIEVTNRFGNTPLEISVRYTNLNLARCLLEKGANMDHQIKTGWTALHAAVSDDKEDMVRLLCSFNADQTLKATYRKLDSSGGKMTPKEVAQKKELNTMVEILESFENVKGKWTDDTDSIVEKMKKGQNIKDLLQSLTLNAKVDINACHLSRDAQYNLLFHALSLKKFGAAKEILKFRPKINWQNDRGSTALLLAAKAGDEEIIEDLLKQGANVDVCNHFKMSALHFASRENHVKIASLLLERKANVNTRMNSGWSPLHDAVLANNVEMVKLMLDYRADKNITATNRKVFPDGKKMTAKDLADKNGNKAIISLLA